MADFELALKEVLGTEKGYANSRHDTGGETICGISRNNHPTWRGWTSVDIIKANGGHPDKLLADAAFMDAVRQFYRKEFWLYDRLLSQGVATKTFDVAVNAGPSAAHKLLQRSLGYVGRHVTIDGVYGPQTETAANLAVPSDLLNEMRAQQALFYVNICIRDATQRGFLLGWLRRAVK